MARNMLTILPKVEAWKKRNGGTQYQGVVKHDWGCYRAH
jgi:hypothetical protein